MNATPLSVVMCPVFISVPWISGLHGLQHIESVSMKLDRQNAYLHTFNKSSHTVDDIPDMHMSLFVGFMQFILDGFLVQTSEPPGGSWKPPSALHGAPNVDGKPRRPHPPMVGGQSSWCSFRLRGGMAKSQRAWDDVEQHAPKPVLDYHVIRYH